MKPLKTHAAAVEEAARHVAVAEERASELRRQLKEAEDEVWRRATDLCDAERRLIRGSARRMAGRCPAVNDHALVAAARRLRTAHIAYRGES